MHILRVGLWGAIRVAGDDGTQESFGHVANDDAIPSAIRRRMGRLERLAVRCTLGVLGGAPTAELIFCSRHGNVETLSTLLCGIAEKQLMSPMAFSGSVHNAAPGLVGQIRKERLSHTALAAGARTFAAGLIECYARLVSDDCRDVTLTFADLRMPDFCRDLEMEDAPGLALALRLERGGPDDAARAIAVRPGRRGVLEVLEALRLGPVCLDMEEPSWMKAAS